MRRFEAPDLNIIGEEYESIAEFYKVNEARDFCDAYRRVGDRNCGPDSEPRDVKGDLRYTWDQTKHDMMYGSTVFDQEFKEVLEEVQNEIPQAWKRGQRDRARKDVIGQSVSVERALMGHPRSFNRRVPSKIKQKTVGFFFNVACPWSTPTKDRLKAGCILMAVCEHLERSGYQTKIMYAPDFSSERESGADNPDYPSQTAFLTLKDYKTRFNLKKMQFPLASESALFFAGCWWTHRFPGTKHDWGYGEGYSVDNSSARQRNAKEFARRQDSIYLSIVMIRKEFHMSVKEVYDYVVSQIDKF